MSFFSDLVGKLPSPPPLPGGPGGDAGQGLKGLRTGFSDFLQNSPLRMLPQFVPGARTPANTAGNPATAAPASTTPAQGNAAQLTPTSSATGGFAPSLSLPPPPPLPGFGNRAANVGNPTPMMPSGPAPGGLLSGAGTLLSNAVGGVVNLLNPAAAGPNPGALPGTSTPTPTSASTAPAGPVTSLATAVLAPVRALFNGAPAAAPTAAPGNAPAQQIAAGLQGQPVQGQAIATQAGPPATAQAPIMQPATAQPAPLAAQNQTPTTLAAPPPQSQTPTQVTQTPTQAAATAQPQRAEAAFASPGNAAAADRAALPAQALPPSQIAAQTMAPAATLVAAPVAVPIAASITQAPAGQQIAGNTQIAGNPQATPPVSGEKGGVSRAEMPMVGVYTADGPGLRRRDRLRLGPQQLGAWIAAMSQGRLQLVRPEDDTAHEVAKAMQWVFWTLAIVAYGCIGLVLIGFLLQHGDVQAAPALRQWTGEFSLVGLVAALGAWWLGRRIIVTSQPAATSPGKPRRNG